MLTCKTFFSRVKSTWEHTNICRSYGARSSQMWCASCSVFAAGSTVSCPTFTVLLDPPDQTRLVGWATRPSRVSPFIHNIHARDVVSSPASVIMFLFDSNRLRHLPCPCAPWWPQTPCAQGCYLWQASAPWRQPDQVCPQFAVHCWGMFMIA